MWTRPRWLGLMAALVAVLFCLEAGAEELPLKLQAALIKKILLFDHTLASGKKAKLVVVYGDEAGPAGELVESLKGLGMEAAAVKSGALSGALAGVDAAYLFPHAASGGSKEALVRAKALSFGGQPALADAGDIGVGLGIKEGRPEIVVNLGVVRAQGHSLGSELLNLARVVK